MNEYNEKALKLILDDYIYMNDEALLKEIEEAAENPLFKADEEKAKAFAKKHSKKCKTIPKPVKRILYSAAAFVLVLVICFSVIPFEVGGQRATVMQYVFDEAGDGYINVFLSTDVLANIKRFKGEYIPTFVPEGYYVESITNVKDSKTIVFTNTENKLIVFSVDSLNMVASIDCDDESNVQEIEVLGFKGIYIENEDDSNIIFFTTNDRHVYISTNDPEVDLLGFANCIEKRK